MKNKSVGAPTTRTPSITKPLNKYRYLIIKYVSHDCGNTLLTISEVAYYTVWLKRKIHALIESWKIDFVEGGQFRRIPKSMIPKGVR